MTSATAEILKREVLEYLEQASQEDRYSKKRTALDEKFLHQLKKEVIYACSSATG